MSIGIGTTPSHSFYLPNITYSDISELIITYSQNDTIILEKELSDIIYDSTSQLYTVTLTQEETANFKFYDVTSKDCVDIQIKGKLITGKIFETVIMHDRVYKTLHTDII